MASIHIGTLSASGTPTYNSPYTTGYYMFDVDLSDLQYGAAYGITGTCGFSRGTGTVSHYDINTEWEASENGEISLPFTSGKLTISKTSIKATVPTKHSQADRSMSINLDLYFEEVVEKFCNKVVYGDKTLIDLTGTTATADKIMQGYGAFGADGAWMDGTAQSYIDGNNLEYGFTDGSLPIVGVAKVDSAHVWDDQLQMMIFGTGQIGTGRVV